MATHKCIKPFQIKFIISSLLILALAITFATAGRILDEEVATPTVAPEDPDTTQAPVSVATVGTGAAAGVTGISYYVTISWDNRILVTLSQFMWHFLFLEIQIM